ncbi:ankyrin [Fomitiporia mediterranea MF3/22]|uniref:ankyrin n=1 Tax=Fomitiporia mediterranea (strain MF3/22) TaxID=694068 RepID=UPI0004407297|nr:ankyrin [Fomitiporia mediterranea MF3/22]EJD03556.1 ankyrin [Fomitiporia mediterranea MF3/22]
MDTNGIETSGASNNERLLAAAREDSEELLLEVFKEGNYDINFKDSLGNTALHYAVSHGSTDVLEHLLEHDDCDVDPINRLEGATPLHLAVKLEDKELRDYVFQTLIDAGADTTIKDKEGDTMLDLLSPTEDQELIRMVRKARADQNISRADIAEDDDDDEGSEGSGSEMSD